MGVGVVVDDPTTGSLAHRFVEKPHALLSRYPHHDATTRAIRDLERWLVDASSTPAPFELDERFVNAGILDTMAHRWNNLITNNDREYVSADSIHAAVDLLFTKLISHGETAKKSRRVAEVRERVLGTYESKETLRELIVSPFTSPLMKI